MERLPERLRIFPLLRDGGRAGCSRIEAAALRGEQGASFDDCSARGGFNADWRRQAWEKIAACDVVACLVGDATHLSEPVGWEIEAAAAQGKQIFAYALAPHSCVIPGALRVRGIAVRRLATESARELVGAA